MNLGQHACMRKAGCSTRPSGGRVFSKQGNRGKTPRAGLLSYRASRVSLRAWATVQVDIASPPTTVSPRQKRAQVYTLVPSGQDSSPAYDRPLGGRPEPLGSSLDNEVGAVNFAVSSSNATAISLVLFYENDLLNGQPSYEIPLDPIKNRTGNVWHIMLPNLDPNLLYGYRLSGLHQDRDGPTAGGQRFDETEVVLDPYARAVVSRRQYGQLGPGHLDYESPDVLGLAPTWPQAACALPARGQEFDWEGDQPLNLPMEDLVVYEMHVRGFTQDKTSGVKAPGTYLGIVEKLDYLKELGVNAMELLPVAEFNELEYYSQIPGSTEYRYNFWGYSTVAFCAPMSRYSFAIAQGGDGGSLVNEFKYMVREAHKRGIEVILDVVFNHTAEGNERGPSLSFRGLDNRIYYMLAPGGEYYNYSGCGNTFNCNQPMVRQFIVDCLRYWVTEFHVDGFRFDLASILTRAHSSWHQQSYDEDGNPIAILQAPEATVKTGAVVDHNGIMTDGAGVPTGTPLSDPPLVEMISEDPILRNTKMIAEAWDCDGLNQVGGFPHYGGRWSEWNGTFRDTVRQFIKGTEGNWAGHMASALCGSPNIYANAHPGEGDWWGNNQGRKWKGGRGPVHSINFITAHDGFTLADLVSYNEKHNLANGENNQDGESHNLSWNCGEEGDTQNMTVNRLRQRQMRNLACALLLAHGVPMLQMGDEYGHSKEGNNNTYCHDSPLNWVDWDQVRRDDTGLVRFMRRLIHFRHSTPSLRRKYYVTDNDIQWHGDKPHKPDWSESSRLVAYTLADGEGGGLYVAFNTAHVPRVVELPNWPGRVWMPVVDTGRVAPYDILVADNELSEEEILAQLRSSSMWIGSNTCALLPWSCVVMKSVEEDQMKVLRSKPVAQQTPGSAPHSNLDLQHVVKDVIRMRTSQSPPSTTPRPQRRQPAALKITMTPAQLNSNAAAAHTAATASHNAAEASHSGTPFTQQQPQARPKTKNVEEILTAAKSLANQLASHPSASAAAQTASPSPPPPPKPSNAAAESEALLTSSSSLSQLLKLQGEDLKTYLAQLTPEERAYLKDLLEENRRLRDQLANKPRGSQ